MGMISIEVKGSFRNRQYKTFSAQDTGHADAVAQAIEYLVTEQLPDAIRLDHELQTEGHAPNKGFAKRD